MAGQAAHATNCVLVLLHGHNAGPYALLPLAWYLRWFCVEKQGPVVVVPKYDTTGIDSLAVLMGRVSAAIDEELRKVGAAPDSTLVVVGQSLGGIAAMNLHACGWSVAHAVAVGSPLRGARFVQAARRHVPLASLLLRDPTFDFLLHYRLRSNPPHSFHTISCGLFSSNFDGCVHRDEATLDDRCHTHEPNLHHVAGWATLQLWRSVWAALALGLQAPGPRQAPEPGQVPGRAPDPGSAPGRVPDLEEVPVLASALDHGRVAVPRSSNDDDADKSIAHTHWAVLPIS
jgi:hypothetical protein